MSNLLSLLKLNVSKNHLRYIKNSFNDNLESIKYDLTIFKSKILKHPNLGSHRKNIKTIIMTEREKKEKYEEIIKKNKLNMDLHHFEDYSPLISIIISYRNDLKGLKRLLKNFEENIKYPSYEIIVVDNTSSDDLIVFLEHLKKSLPLKMIKSVEKCSYSKNINIGVNNANGEYILLLNNNVEPTYGWLNQMVNTALKSDDVGAVGAKLVYRECFDSVYNKNNSFKIESIGITFKKDLEGFIEPYNIGRGLEPFEIKINSEELRLAVSGAALLVQKEKYLQVKGLDEGYDEGYEDVDLCLKLYKMGYNNIYCPNAIIFYYDYIEEKGDIIKTKKIKNRKLFNQKWDYYLPKQFLMDKLNDGKLFSVKPLKIAFAVTETGEKSITGDYFTAFELGESLKKFGWQIIFVTKTGSGYWYEIDQDVDVLISLLDVYDPRRIRCLNKSLIKIAWPRNWFDRWVSHPGFLFYDLIFAPSKPALEYINKKSNKKSFLLPIATNTAKFNGRVTQKKEYLCDYCFTGSYWNYPREIIDMLEPEEIPYTFKLFGKNWDKIDKFKKYNQGFINYSKLPEIYKSTKIVIDDANCATKKYGAVNSRVFDALACGALIITNGEIGAKETFNGKLPVFRSKKELSYLIGYYLSNDNERSAKIKELQKFVLDNHTYINRAKTLKGKLKQYIAEIQ